MDAGAAYLDNGRTSACTVSAVDAAAPPSGRPHRRAESHVKPILECLGVAVHFAEPYNAKAKVIEPWFKIVAENFDKRWPTYCRQQAGA